MKTKKQMALAVIFVLLLSLTLLGACGQRGRDLSGKVIVTFQFNGGTLAASTNFTGSIKHAYDPGSYVIDVSSYQNYSFYRSNYVFEGWFKDEGCTDEWDFQKDRVTHDLTLYAKWVPDIRYTYGVYMAVEGQEPVLLGSYRVEQGDKFDDKTNYCDKVRDYQRTFLGGYYSDETLNQPWDDNFVHPGGEQSTEVKVYVDSTEGLWRFVTNYDELRSAMSSTDGVWLMNDIDCGGNELYYSSFNKALEGNNFKIKNFTVPIANPLPTYTLRYSIFGTLGAKTSIRNVTFENVRFVLEDSRESDELRIAGLAQSVQNGAAIQNVHVYGTFVNNLGKSKIETDNQSIRDQFARLSFDDYDESKVTVQDFSAEITPVQD